MKCAATLALVIAALCNYPIHAVRRHGAGHRSVDTHPIEKVVVMLEGLMAKTESEAKDEEVLYTKFAYYCKNSKKTLASAIAESKEEIDTLKDGIASRLQEEELLKDQISDLETEIGEQETAMKEADDLNTQRKADYKEADKNFEDTIKAIEDSIALLEKSLKDTDKLLLAQQSVSNLLAWVQPRATSEQVGALQAFVAEKPRPKFEAKGDRATHVKKYAFKSGSVIEILKQLSLKFQDEKLAATKAETNSLNAHALAKDSQEDAIKQAKASKDEKNKLLGAAKDDRTKMESSLKSAENDLSDDSDTLEKTKKSCAVKQAEWSERSETRKLELEAMKMAIKILAKVGGVRTEAPSNPVPPTSPVSLLETSTDPRIKAMQLLRASAAATHSHLLERMAQEISAAKDGHFDEVINMIEKMIFRLMDEQTDEDKHKNWCDEELEKTDVSIKNKADKIKELDAKIKEAEAMVAKLTGDIEEADKMVSKITEHIAEASDIRKTGKKQNELAIKDARAAQQAVSNAISVLESFYKESGMVKKEAWELLQQPVKLPKEPSTWDSGYTGVADPAKQPGGIITVLKTVSADFAKMESDTLAQEESDQKLFEDEMKSCEIEKARRMSQSKEEGAERKRQAEKAVSLKASHKTVSGQKESVEQYLKDLQHGCVDGDSTYEDRKAARKKEIDALKEAEKTLTDAFKAAKAPKLIALRR